MPYTNLWFRHSVRMYLPPHTTRVYNVSTHASSHGPACYLPGRRTHFVSVRASAVRPEMTTPMLSSILKIFFW